MFKYAEIYGGKVRDLKESHLPYVEFCSIWDPTCFWMDVTGIDEIGIDWVLKASTEIGTYFDKPSEYEEEVTLESKKAGKLEILTNKFKEVLETAFLLSSLGFYINAGERAKGDVDGIITQMEAENIETKMFMDYEDVIQVITLDEAKVLQLEIIKNGEFVYQQKWELRNRINNATTIEEVDQIQIAFDMYDFINNAPILDFSTDETEE